MATWQLQTAKAKLSELLRAVREDGPQTISVRGKEEFVVSVKVESEAANEHAPMSGLDIFRPVLGLGVKLDIPPRDPEGHRRLWFEDEVELADNEVSDESD
jgi:prevent-host-death family protein